MMNAAARAVFSKMEALLFLVVSVIIASGSATNPFLRYVPRESIKWSPSSEADPGEPLFLTPYIQKGQIAEAKKLSEVHGAGPLPSYSGFFTVNETDNGNMFFWFFPPQNGDPNAPVILWLQGGPGASSLFGLFNENGPYYVDQDGNIQSSKVTWNSQYAMLYIDNPVGTGFSFTGSDAGYSTNELQVGYNLYSALTQFFEVFTEYQTNDFYVAGESYAGKYVPAIGYRIHLANLDPTTKLKIALKGVMIGDGFSDPVNMIVEYSDLIFNYGMADENEAKFILNQMQRAIGYIDAALYLNASEVWGNILGEYFDKITGGADTYNILRSEEPASFNYYLKLWADDDIRRAVHVGNLSYGHGGIVGEKLANDFMQSVVGFLSILMDNYKVLIYNGQLDIVVGPPLTEAYLQVLPWSGTASYLIAEKKVWKINPSDTEVAGYTRTVGNFTQAIVKGAGHILPYDQPERAFDMIDRFVSGKGF